MPLLFIRWRIWPWNWNILPWNRDEPIHEDIQAIMEVFNAVYDLFNISFTIGGFEITFWQILIFSIVSSLIMWAIGRIFDV